MRSKLYINEYDSEKELYPLTVVFPNGIEAVVYLNKFDLLKSELRTRKVAPTEEGFHLEEYFGRYDHLLHKEAD